MKITHVTPILNVSDVPASLAWFGKLGWKTLWTWPTPFGTAPTEEDDLIPTFAAVGNEKTEIFLCLDGQGGRDDPEFQAVHGDDMAGNGTWMSLWLATPAEVDDVYTVALEQGIEITWPPTDEPWGVRECWLRHPDGHTFRISAPTA